MPIALHTAGLASQSRQGVGARLVRRLGGAVRSAIVRGITLAGSLRRPAASQTSQHRTAAQQSQAPAPSRLPLPRPPRAPSTSTSPAPRAKRAGEGVAPLPPPWLAHLLAARRHRRPAATSRPAGCKQGDIHFTPQAFPQLNAKACAVLNTPLKDCDPKTLKLLFSAFTQHINQVMSPEAGITDPAAVFPNLLHRLNAALAGTKAAPSLSTTPQAVPATPADTVPDAPIASPDPPALVSTFTQHINQVMSPEAGITDPAAAFPNLWHRLNAALADTNAGASLSTTPQPVPATSTDAVPDAPIASPGPPAQAPTTGPTTPSAKDAPSVSPLSLFGPPASDPPTHATITPAAPRSTPHIPTPSAPVARRSRSCRYRTRSFARWRRRHVRCRRALFPRSLRASLQCPQPPPHRLYYAACTGPPRRIARRIRRIFPSQMNGATAWGSRDPDSCRANLAEPHRPLASLPASFQRQPRLVSTVVPRRAPVLIKWQQENGTTEPGHLRPSPSTAACRPRGNEVYWPDSMRAAKVGVPTRLEVAGRPPLRRPASSGRVDRLISTHR
jgi:hypothetical protein